MVASEHLPTSPTPPLMSLSEIYPNIENIHNVHRGKVRESIDLGDRLLVVATDRISVFDVVLPTGIPEKGKILTEMSNSWFNLLDVPNHRLTGGHNEFPEEFNDPRVVERSMLVHKLEMVPIEAIVRGYISGSAWKEYKATGKFVGQNLPLNLVESDRLEYPLYTPSTKAPMGEHDNNIDFNTTVDILRNRFPQHDARQLARSICDVSLYLYMTAAEYALSKGIIIPDTKFEFGVLEDESLILADEVLTPDSSRFWPANKYEPGRSQDSFDKQYVRDYTDLLGWDHTYPGPALPIGVIKKTVEKYREAQRMLFG